MKRRRKYKINPRGDSAKMTRQHFEFIARVIRESSLSVENRDLIAFDFVRELALTNSNFDGPRFRQAATGTKKNPPRKPLKLGKKMKTVSMQRPELFKPPYNVSVNYERDNLDIWLSDKDDKSIAHWHDDDARQMIEDGFFNARRGYTEAFAESVVQYAHDMGMIK